MKFLRNDPLSKLLGTNVGLGSSIEIFAASGPHFQRERTLQQTSQDRDGGVADSLAGAHDGSYTGCSCLFRRGPSSPDRSKASGTSRHAPRRRAQRQRRDGQDHGCGSKSELADASASSRSPPLTEAKDGRNCSAQGRPVPAERLAEPCFTRQPGVGPISLHEAKAFPGGAWEQN